MSTVSFWGWCRFALARDFVHLQPSPAGQRYEIYPYQPTLLERCGRALRWGVGSALDLLLREIKNPITIVALTALAALIVTIAFYPEVVMHAIVTVLPFAAHFKPWMAKMAVYILAQTTILGLGLRAYGRFQNDALVAEWRAGRIEPIFIGTRQLADNAQDTGNG